jgi:flagellar basal body-associated protein FliL
VWVLLVVLAVVGLFFIAAVFFFAGASVEEATSTADEPVVWDPTH